MKVIDLINKLQRLNPEHEINIMDGWENAKFYKIIEVNQFTDQCADFSYIRIEEKNER